MANFFNTQVTLPETLAGISIQSPTVASTYYVMDRDLSELLANPTSSLANQISAVAASGKLAGYVSNDSPEELAYAVSQIGLKNLASQQQAQQDAHEAAKAQIKEEAPEVAAKQQAGLVENGAEAEGKSPEKSVGPKSSKENGNVFFAGVDSTLNGAIMLAASQLKGLSNMLAAPEAHLGTGTTALATPVNPFMQMNTPSASLAA